ncbi:MAG TPA: hypothetical protein ENJ95_08545 [Bacteroidetes bacterium]|nr:hypothetical protein [Bacteroidota bacterium]
MTNVIVRQAIFFDLRRFIEPGFLITVHFTKTDILHQVDFQTFWLRLLHLNFVKNTRRSLGYACVFRLVQAQNTLPKTVRKST